MNTDSSTSSCVTFGLLAASIVPMTILVNSTPDRIPADVIAEDQEKNIDGISIKAAFPVDVKK
jgi:hypothetical protein